MSATQAQTNVAEVLCQSKQNFGSYSIFGDDRFLCHPVAKLDEELLLRVQPM